MFDRNEENILMKQEKIFKNVKLVYYDESGDDGNPGSSDDFVLTCIYMDTNDWQENFNIFRDNRRELKEKYGFHIAEEFHAKPFLTDKNPYREYKWSTKERKEIFSCMVDFISKLKIRCVSIVIDKKRIKNDVDYNILQNALTYSLQRIENDTSNMWNYIAIADKGRVEVMRRISRLIRVYNPIPSLFNYSSYNSPIKNMIEDIFEKESKDSYFIQIADTISYIIHLYYITSIYNQDLPNRVKELLNKEDIINYLEVLKEKGVLNIKASSNNKYGIVIYPK